VGLRVVAIRPRSPETADALRATAIDPARGPRPEGALIEGIAVAQGIRILSEGDTAPLLEAVLHGLGGRHYDRSDAAEATADLPEHADVLVPRMLETLAAFRVPNPNIRAHQARMRLGHTLRRFTGEPGHLISVLSDALDPERRRLSDWTVAAAADQAAELGLLAHELQPAIEAALENPATRPAAAHALLAIDSEGPWATTRREELAEHLISTLTGDSPVDVRDRALGLLADLAPLPKVFAVKLCRLAEQDERVFATGSDPNPVRADDTIRARILTLLATMTGTDTDQPTIGGS
jgi:hypothetical protein